jgi:hypothetical protein
MKGYGYLFLLEFHALAHGLAGLTLGHQLVAAPVRDLRVLNIKETLPQVFRTGQDKNIKPIVAHLDLDILYVVPKGRLTYLKTK